MKHLHWRYDTHSLSTSKFLSINDQHHYSNLLERVIVPTLVIDINLINELELEKFLDYIISKIEPDGPVQFQQIILDHTQDPMQGYERKCEIIEKFATQKSIKIILSTSQFDTKKHQNFIEINYPSWLISFKKQSLPAWNVNERSYLFSCLNRNPTFHRLILYTKIKQRGLLDQFVYSFYDRCPYQGHPITAYQYRGIEGFVGEAEANLCRQNLQDFPLSWAGEILGENDHSINHPAYQDTWCNIVTETSAVISFTSEKIWKPIAAGQMFLIAGAPGTAAWLRGLGFYTFEDHYDLNINLSSRFDLLVDIVERHRNDAREWWYENRFHIEHNYHWFHSGNVEKNLLDSIIDQLNHKY